MISYSPWNTGMFLGYRFRSGNPLRKHPKKKGKRPTAGSNTSAGPSKEFEKVKIEVKSREFINRV